VGWDDEIPNMMGKSFKIPWFQSPPTSHNFGIAITEILGCLESPQKADPRPLHLPGGPLCAARPHSAAAVAAGHGQVAVGEETQAVGLWMASY